MVCVGLNAAAPVSRSGVHRGMEDISKVVGNLREVAPRHVEPQRPHTRSRKPVSISRLAESRSPPDFVALRKCARNREGNLSGGTRDQYLLAVDHANLSHDFDRRRRSLQPISLRCEDLTMSTLVGTPSDDAPAIVATGRADIT